MCKSSCSIQLFTLLWELTILLLSSIPIYDVVHGNYFLWPVNVDSGKRTFSKPKPVESFPKLKLTEITGIVISQ
jgi:hypothetical protein